ncbi:MAG: peptidoglycan editing factor PgeF [Kineosporiaceae bacterium]
MTGPRSAHAAAGLVTDLTWGRVRLVVTGRGLGGGVPPLGPGNLGSGVGDDPATVAANRGLLAGSLGVRPGALHFLRQVHGARVLVVPPGAPAPDPGAEPEADGAVVTAPGQAVAVTAADCLPLLLADPDAGVAAAVHVGRRGLVAGIAPEAVRSLAGRGARRVRALLGPAVCGACYEVPAAMRDEVAAAAPGSAAVTRSGTPAVDIAAGVRRQLADAGVDDVVATGRCTVEDPALFSHRRDRPTGRMAGVVAVLA